MKKKKKVTNIISFDDEEDEQNPGDVLRGIVAGESSEENLDRFSPYVASPPGPGEMLAKRSGDQSVPLLKNDSVYLNGDCGFPKLDVKSIDDEDVDENDEAYGKILGNRCVAEDTESCGKWVFCIVPRHVAFPYVN